MKGWVRTLSAIAPSMAIRQVTKLFTKPQGAKAGSKHATYYGAGQNEVRQIRDYQVHLHHRGEGQRVLLVHGWNSMGYHLRQLAHVLATQGFEVIIPDLPGHGKSTKGAIDPIEVSRVLEELMLRLNSEKEIDYIVSQGWGGTATLLALDRCIGHLNIKRIVAMSMPATPDAMLDSFAERLELIEEVEKGLRISLDQIARKDGRALEETFPMGMPNLLSISAFDMFLIHDVEDSVVPAENSLSLGERYPAVHVKLTTGLDHYAMPRYAEIHNEVLKCLKSSNPVLIS